MQIALIVYFLGLLPTAMWIDCGSYFVNGHRAGVNFSSLGVCVVWPVVVPAVLCLVKLREQIDGN